MCNYTSTYHSIQCPVSELHINKKKQKANASSKIFAKYTHTHQLSFLLSTCFCSIVRLCMTAFLPPTTWESRSFVLYDAPIYFNTAPTTSRGESTIEILPASSGLHRSPQSCNDSYGPCKID